MAVNKNFAKCVFCGAAKTQRMSPVNTTKKKQTSICNFITELVMLLHVVMLQHGEKKEFGYIYIKKKHQF